MEKKITKKDILRGIIDTLENGSSEILEEDIISYCRKEIGALDRKAEKAKEAAQKRKAEGDELTDKIREVVDEDYETIADITAKVDDENASVGKVSYRLSQLVKMGELEKSKITIGEGSDKRGLVAYRRVVD